jgi:P2 family phage major capsid protein
VRKKIADGIITCGFNGTSRATTTNLSSNPLLQDLNKGWLQLIREFNSASQYVIGTTPSPISLGSTGVFKNLDSLVFEALNRLPEYYLDAPDLVVLVGRGVMNKAIGDYYEALGLKPTEKTLLENTNIVKTFSSLPTMVPPRFPTNAVLVTSLDNLSYYYQDSSIRRMQKDNPNKNRVEDFNSVNAGYVIEDEFKTSLVENITFVD